MPRLFTPERASCGLGFAFAAGLIAAHIIANSGWDWRHHLTRGATSPRTSGVIERYVKFTEVTAGQIKVTTGQRYKSSANRSIERQWCYAEPINHSDSLAYHLDLAFIEAGGPIELYPFTPEVARQFGLSEADMVALTKNHCHFNKKEP